MRSGMSNFEVLVQGDDERELGHALALAVDSPLQRWAEVDGWLVIGWAPPESKGGNLFPSKLKADELTPIVARWLREHPAPRDEEPDHDGSNSQGFQLVAGYESIGKTCLRQREVEHRAGFYVELAVRSIWSEHHK
jgi:hypothetical protein